jgi:hypothetical protein
VNVRDKVREFIPVGEKILAGVMSEPIRSTTPTTPLWFATEQRLGRLFRTGWFSWDFWSVGWEKITQVTMELNTAFEPHKHWIYIYGDRIHISEEIKQLIEPEIAQEIGAMEHTIANVPWKDGRHFVSVATKLIQKHRGRTAHSPKPCPQCDEVLEWYRSSCHNCGYEFT